MARFDNVRMISYKGLLIVLLSVFVLSCKKDDGASSKTAKTTAPVGLEIGNAAPDFTQPDIDGKPVALSSFLGKYVLVDFWASWCWPCERAAPGLVKVYEDLKDNNFIILGVSTNSVTEKAAWESAYSGQLSSWPVMPWPQVSDLKSPNEAAARYEVSGIPTTFLVDPTGKIIGKGAPMSESEIRSKVPH